MNSSNAPSSQSATTEPAACPASSLQLGTRVPDKGTQCYELLRAMNRGERLTVAKALNEYGCYALSQRIGELKRKYGWPVSSVTVATAGGARVKEYWL